MKLIGLNDYNQMATTQRKWAPVRGGFNGLACPSCGQELKDTPDLPLQIREDGSNFRKVECTAENRAGEPCSFKGVREIF